MRQPMSAIAVGALALGVAGFAAVAHQSSTVRAQQAAAATTPASSTYSAPVAPAPAPVAPAAVAVPPPGYALVPVTGAGNALAVATPVATQQHVVTRTRTVYRTAAPRYVVHRRSKRHSAEIIGGSALGGAGIGALVGGGKGALIGGLIGGGAGTVYDRKTHKKVVRE
jgi:hypothetical protein